MLHLVEGVAHRGGLHRGGVVAQAPNGSSAGARVRAVLEVPGPPTRDDLLGAGRRGFFEQPRRGSPADRSRRWASPRQYPSGGKAHRAPDRSGRAHSARRGTRRPDDRGRRRRDRTLRRGARRRAGQGAVRPMPRRREQRAAKRFADQPEHQVTPGVEVVHDQQQLAEPWLPEVVVEQLGEYGGSNPRAPAVQVRPASQQIPQPRSTK